MNKAIQKAPSLWRRLLKLAMYPVVQMPGKSYSAELPSLLPSERESEARLAEIVAKLTGFGERNSKNYAGLKKSAQYISALFSSFGYEVQVQEFEYQGKKMWNIEVELKGTRRASEIIVVGAHYDSAFGSPGADDNASGTASLLELARLLKNSKPACTIRFVAFANEEHPGGPRELMGSYAYAERCWQRDEKVVGMLSLEMLGAYYDWKDSQKYPKPFASLYPTVGNFVAFVGSIDFRKIVTRCVGTFRDTTPFPCEGVAAPEWFENVGRSDHYAFWAHGFPAVMVTDTAEFRYTFYHTADDTADKIDYARLALVTGGLACVIADLAGTPHKFRRGSDSGSAVRPAPEVVLPAADPVFNQTVADYAEAQRGDYETALKSLVDIPSVSVDPAHKDDIARAAQTARALLESIGAKAEVIPTNGNPVVYGEILSDPGNQTVLIYNHLDVQPADPSEWERNPFCMSIEDGVYRGRGTTDDKGPAMAALFAAKYAVENKLPVNIKFLWELEEEIGGPSFDAFVKANQDRLKCDSIVIADTIWVSRDRPAIPYGLRGLQGFLLRLTTGAKDVHSGTTGGVARNPIGELCQLIDQCYDARTGEIKIPGIYDTVREPSKTELANFVKSGFSVENFQRAHELSGLRTDQAEEAALRIWARPTFEVHGITGGYSGPGIKTIVPHKAEAKISMRLVPDQNPDQVAELVTKFVASINPDVEVVKLDGLRPYLGEFTGPYYKAASRAMTLAFNKEAAYTREGGSIGAALSMNELLSAPIVFLGLSLPEHGYHAVNENFDWQQAGGGIRMFVHYFTLLGSIKK